MNLEEYVIRAVEAREIPRYLYKYRASGPRTDSIIEDSCFWFSRSKDFNDPFDCNLSETRSHRLNDYKKYIAKSGVISREQSRVIAKIAKKDPQFLLKTALKTRAETLNEHGLLSLSKNHDNILMWSHYSSSHQGLVIALDVLKDPRFF